MNCKIQFPQDAKVNDTFVYRGTIHIFTECPNCHKPRWIRHYRLGTLCRQCSCELVNARPDVVKRKSESLKGYREFRFHKGKKRGTRLGFKCSVEHKEKVRQNSLAQWRNPVTRDRIVKAILEVRSPNKHEVILEKLLNDNFANEWKFVGDGSIIINGLSPDFINVNGKKLIIEYFGRPWHRPQDAHYKIKEYAKFGYRTLVIWSDKFRDKKYIISEVDKWINSKESYEVGGLI